jgi:hypothetical protein
MGRPYSADLRHGSDGCLRQLAHFLFPILEHLMAQADEHGRHHGAQAQNCGRSNQHQTMANVQSLKHRFGCPYPAHAVRLPQEGPRRGILGKKD